MVKLDVELDDVIIGEVEALLQEYKDVFAWSYKDLTLIPPHIDFNYVTVVKHDLDKLLLFRFIASIEKTTSLKEKQVFSTSLCD
jgi:hypothetical protein